MGISCAKNLEIRKTLHVQATSRTRTKKQLENIIGRRRSALNKAESEYPEAATAEIIPNTIKTGEDIEKIKAALNSHFIFTSLTEEDKDMVIQSMQLYSFQADSYVFMQSSRARSYYVIRTGSIEVFVNNKKVNKIHAGEGFGELALLQDNPRSASLKCAEATTLWGLDRETFRKVIEEMNVQIYQQNRQFLEKVGLLDSLTPQQKDLLAVSLVSRKYFTGQNIITEGETGNEIFFVKEGIVGLFKGTQEIKKFYPGSYFGENALINNTPRTATCRALEDHVKCMCLTRETLQKVLSNKLQDIIEKNTIYEAIKKSTRLSALTKEQKESLFKSITERNYKAGDVVIAVGTTAVTKMIFVMSGRLQYAKTSALFCDKGSVIGDVYVTRTLNEDVKYEEDFIAGCDMKVGEITKYQFEMAIGGKYEDIIKENAATNVLRKIFLFTSIDSVKMKELFSMITIEKRKDSEILLREGVSSNCVYIVKRGKVDVFQAGNLIKTIRKLGFFGERSLIDLKPSIYTYVANGNVTLWNIKLINLARLINDKMIDQLNRRLDIEDEDAELNSLTIIRELGRGNNSLVYLVRTPKDSLYALKVITRDSIEKYALYDKVIVSFIQQEKKILSQLDHPFINRLIKSYKDSSRFYFLLEYVKGLSLEQVMSYIGILSNTDSVFYAASIMLALEYLHQRDILYRDLAPENVIIDKEGYICLVDFSSAKLVQGRTYTLIGTAFYTAPEVITGRGYSKSADIWSLGIMIYEFVCGFVPFGHEESDPYRVYESILSRSLEFPSNHQPAEPVVTLLKSILNKYSETRLNETIENVKNFEWFSSVDWEDLYCKVLIPPYKPLLKKNLDETLNEYIDPSQEWDYIIQNDIDNQSNSSPVPTDPQIEEYRSSVPHNWDTFF